MISNMSSTLSNIDASSVQRRQKLDTLNDYLRYRRVPIALRKRIAGYYDCTPPCSPHPHLPAALPSRSCTEAVRL